MLAVLSRSLPLFHSTTACLLKILRWTQPWHADEEYLPQQHAGRPSITECCRRCTFLGTWMKNGPTHIPIIQRSALACWLECVLEARFLELIWLIVKQTMMHHYCSYQPMWCFHRRISSSVLSLLLTNSHLSLP